MKVEFDIDDNKVKCFSNGARTELTKQAERHTYEIVAEAERVEASFNTAGAQPEITPEHVKQAVIKSKANPSKKRKWWYIACQIIALVGMLIAGILFDTDAFTSDIGQIIFFLIVAVLALGCAIAVILSDHFER